MLSLVEPGDATGNADSWAMVPGSARNDCFTRGHVCAELLPARAGLCQPVSQASLHCEPKGPWGVMGATSPWGRVGETVGGRFSFRTQLERACSETGSAAEAPSDWAASGPESSIASYRVHRRLPRFLPLSDEHRAVSRHSGDGRGREVQTQNDDPCSARTMESAPDPQPRSSASPGASRSGLMRPSRPDHECFACDRDRSSRAGSATRASRQRGVRGHTGKHASRSCTRARAKEP